VLMISALWLGQISVGFDANAGCRGFHLDVHCGYREETFPGATGNGQASQTRSRWRP